MGMLDCGCTLGPVMSPEQAKAHFGHTFQAIIVWDILMSPEGREADDKLMMARLAYIEALENAFPVVVGSLA